MEGIPANKPNALLPHDIYHPDAYMKLVDQINFSKFKNSDDQIWNIILLNVR